MSTPRELVRKEAEVYGWEKRPMEALTWLGSVDEFRRGPRRVRVEYSLMGKIKYASRTERGTTSGAPIVITRGPNKLTRTLDLLAL